MPVSDLLVLGGTLFGTALLFGWHRSVRARGGALFAATWLGFFGLFLVLSMFAHTVEILWHVARGDTQTSGEPWTYDFRAYSLLLLGAVLMAIGFGVLGASANLSRGRRNGRRASALLTLSALAVTLPLIPIQAFFGVLVSGLAGVTLLVLWAAPRTEGRL
jgi:hypothetical protein